MTLRGLIGLIVIACGALLFFEVGEAVEVTAVGLIAAGVALAVGDRRLS